MPYTAATLVEKQTHWSTRCLSILLLPCLAMPSIAVAQNLVLSPAAQSPHWPHITTWDYGRLLFLNPPTAAYYEWYIDRLDAIEVHGNGPTVRGYNPTSEEFSYWFDSSDYQSHDVSGLAESGFLHFSEDTNITFYDLAGYQGGAGTSTGSVSITGCPGAAVPSCRVQTYHWSNLRYLFNLNDSAFRTWQSARILSNVNVYGFSADQSQRVWLDEHSPGFSWPESFGWQNWITSGGAIKEYGGRRPYKLGVQDYTLDEDYGQDSAEWLAVLRTNATAAGKKVLINSGPELFHTSFNSPLLAQANAIKGFATESVHLPQGFANATIYNQWVTQTQTTVGNGGIVDLSTIWCNTGPAGYTAGIYQDAAQRFRMWRLASYYHFKEPVGSTGKVYFNVGFCSNNIPSAAGQVAADQANWAPAYQVDVGQPMGPMTVHQTGTVAGCAYTIYVREYTKAYIYVRPKDSASCNTYDNTTSVVFNFPFPMKVLPHNGDLTGQPFATAFILNNAEALIAMYATVAPCRATTRRLGIGSC